MVGGDSTHPSNSTHSHDDAWRAKQRGSVGALGYRTEKLNSLEVGRGLAALFVLLYHYRGLCVKYIGAPPSLAGAFLGGHAGVEYFFVLSGFIIYFIHRDDIGNKQKIARFFLKRIIRIIPMYWLVITLMLIGFYFNSNWGSEKDLTAHSILADYFLIAHNGPSILPPSWTLKREAFFYVLFGVTIAAPITGTLLFVIWQSAIISVNIVSIIAGNDLTLMSPFFLDIHNFGFAVGIVCAILARRAYIGLNILTFAILFVAVVCIAANMYIECVQIDGMSEEKPQNFQDQSLHSFFYTMAFGLIVFALVEIERVSKYTVGSWISVFGSASYLIYIIHEPFASLVIKIMQFSGILRKFSANGLYILEIALVLSFAMLLHRLVERPITTELRRRYTPRVTP